MIIISDTSALSALLRIGEIQILGNLYGQIIIPSGVYEELLPLAEIGVDVAQLDAMDWLKVRPLTKFDLYNQIITELDQGEAEAIALAVELKADWLIIDELYGREVARKLSVPIIGIGGVLVLAKRKGIIRSVKNILDRLRSVANFRLADNIYQQLLHAADE